VAKDHILIAFGATLTCFRYYPQKDPTSILPKLKWTHLFPFGGTLLRKAAISALEPIGGEHVLVGSSHGHLALIQWKRVVQAAATSSFSIMSAAVKRYAPTVLCQWLSYSSLQQIPPETDKEPTLMGIQQLQVEEYQHQVVDQQQGQRPQSQSQSRNISVDYEQLFGRFRVQWVTRCGWVVSVTMVASPSGSWSNYKVRREKPRIVHQPAPVKTRLASGGWVTLSATKGEWSLPTERVATDGGPAYLCWQKVAPVTRILPHHDQRVLDSTPSIVRIPNDDSHLYLQTLNSMDTSGGNRMVHSLSLPVRKGRPKVIAVDPSNQEWVVIATSQEQLYVVHLQCSA
jgi:hypothetical protein